MKQLLSLLMSLGIMSLSAQLISFTPNDSILTTLSISNGADVIEAFLTAENNTSVSKSMKWAKSELTISKDWVNVQVCDPGHCWGSDAFTTTHSYTLGPNTSGIFKVDFNTNCVSGSGKVRIKTWETADSANTVQYINFQFDLTATSNCITTAINDFKADNLRFYPNPVKDNLKIIGISDLKNTKVEFFNVIGSKVMSKNIDNTNGEEIEINTESLDQGIYFCKFYSNNKLIATKKFTKE